MNTTRCLAYIWPAEDIRGKESALANVRFLTGPLKRKTVSCQLTTSIYTYYYWGVAFEVVTVTDNGAITGVDDVNKEDLAVFGMSLIHALSFNSITHEVLGSNGFVYKLDHSLFYRNCQPVCEYIYSQMETANNIIMQMYTLDGGIIAVLFDKDLPVDSSGYKFAIQRGFVTANNKLLSGMVSKSEVPEDNHEVMKQKDIDRLIERMTEEKRKMDQFTTIYFDEKMEGGKDYGKTSSKHDRLAGICISRKI